MNIIPPTAVEILVATWKTVVIFAALAVPLGLVVAVWFLLAAYISKIAFALAIASLVFLVLVLYFFFEG